MILFSKKKGKKVAVVPEVEIQVENMTLELNDIVGFVNTARLSDSDIVESDLEGNKKSYSYRNFLLTLDDLINDYDYEELKDAFFEIVHKYAWKEIIVSIKSAY